VIAAPVVNNTAINTVFCLRVLFGVSTGAISSVEVGAVIETNLRTCPGHSVSEAREKQKGPPVRSQGSAQAAPAFTLRAC